MVTGIGVWNEEMTYPPMRVSFHRCCFQASKDTWLALADVFSERKNGRLAKTIRDGLENRRRRAERNYGYDMDWCGLCFRDGSIELVREEMIRLNGAFWGAGEETT